MKGRTKVELLAWVEQYQPVTRERLLAAFEDMDYEQLQRWQIFDGLVSNPKGFVKASKHVPRLRLRHQRSSGSVAGS